MEAEALIAALELQPHPEGGWYRETWRAAAAEGARAAGTAILFLLKAGERSHWHRVDAAEVWLWHRGGTLALSVAETDAGPALTRRLGGDIAAGEAPQLVVPAGHWQAAAPEAGHVLVSCVVAPGFDFAGFELAPEGFEIPG
ncbi:cupin domain-containing protein [Frigidibacter sp. MR17.14]|uniref:cupin domain-containing protein n=1 Tax=Frigidibacter sp. MR17.14 TaxID=3126509 RepID=UPI003012E185